MYKNIDVKLESTVAGPVSVVCLEAIATRTSQFVIYAHHFECWMLNADHRIADTRQIGSNWNIYICHFLWIFHFRF